MSNIFGNRGGGGGFANPATEELDMNNYKITQVGQPTVVGDVQGYGQNALFSSVNMNNNWLIPNTQPASQSDTNQYVLAAQGGLIIPNYSNLDPGAPFVSILFSRPSLPTDLSFQLTVPNNVPISYLDLCESFKQQFNNQVPAQYIGQMAMTGCDFILSGSSYRFRCTCVNFAYPSFPFTANSYTLVGRTGPDTLRSNLGIWADASNVYGQIVQGSQGIAFTVSVAWSAASGSQPITNGAPFTYSIPNQKWVLTSPYSTPDYLNTLTFDNTQYSIVQNGVARVSSTAFSTYMMAPNGITNSAVSNNGIGIIVDTVNRFSALSGGATSIKSFDDTMSVVLASNAFEASTSTNNKILLTSSGFTYAHNNIQKMIMNANNFVVSNGATPRLEVSGSNSIISAPAGLNRLYLDDSLMKYDEGAQNRLLIDTVRSRVISPSGVYTLESNNSGVGLVANGTTRMGISGFQSYVYSPDYHSLFANTDTYISMEQAGFSKFHMSEDPLIGTSLWGPSGSGKIELLNARINLRQNSVNRFVINNAETYSFAPSLLNYSYKSDTEMANFFNSVNRFSIGSTSCVLRSPDSNNYINVRDTGLNITAGSVSVFDCEVGGITQINSPANTSTLYLETATATLTNGNTVLLLASDISLKVLGQTRIHADSSHSQLLSPNGLQAVEANNTGVQINLGTDNYKLPTTRGTVGQVLTYSGVNTTWANPGSSYNAGFSLFSPLESTGTIGSGNKPYWYKVMVPCNTVLTGFKTYLTTGSDPFHVAIYRGITPNSALTILDLLAPIVTVAGAGYYSAAFVVQAGRSNIYTAGEYITVMYHSQGSTNSFYNFIAASDTNLAYTTSANYGNSTPPANLGGTPVLGTIANRLAIEFY